jgi:hypothetical protein
MIGYGNSVFLRTAWEVSGGVPPVNTVAPAITGTAQEGQTVTCSTGTWTGTPTITFAYQWKRNGSNIGSATNSTYTLVTADVSQSITCQVTATNGSGSASATSNTITPTAALDPDAQAFITAAGITNPTQQGAINNLVIGLKADGLWTKMKAIYPIVGGTAASHKFNLKDPRDLDAAFRLTFATGVTHSSTGMQGNGSSGYAETYLNDNTDLALNSAHISIYSRTNKDALMCDIGIFDAGTISGINIFSKYTNTFFGRVHNENTGIANSTSSFGLFVANRVGSTETRNFQNGVLKLTSGNSVAKNNSTITIMARNRGFKDFYSDRQIAFASIGDGLSDTDGANFYTAVQAYQTTLSRQV